MKLGVIGTGYVGLVTAAGFASRGHHVTCVDIDSAKIASLRVGKVPWHEPGLGDLVVEAVRAGLLEFTTDPSRAARGTDLIFVAVGTPPREDGSANTDAIFSAARSLVRGLAGPVTVVVRSTVPVGTSQAVRAEIKSELGFDCPVLSNPEFLREGIAVEDFLKPNRVVIGADGDGEEVKLRELYRSVATPERIVVMDTRSAELSKYACNTFLATKISFINQVADLCDALGADIEHVRKVMGMDPRIGSGQLKPGLGYGGSCLPKDTQAMLDMGKKVGIPLPLIAAANAVNSMRPERLISAALGHFGGSIAGRRIAVWGLAFKPGTDDLREAPSIPIIRQLTALGATVVAYDPVAMPATRALLDGATEYAGSYLECAKGADAVVLVTEWDEFKNCDISAVKSAMRSPVFFDGRNVFDPRIMARSGFRYYGVGRGQTTTRGGKASASEILGVAI